MTSVSPPTPTVPLHSPGLEPKGGILLNGDRRLSEPTSPRIIIPKSSPGLSPGPLSATSTKSSEPRIRFAPLPEPNRPRSLSTGRNIAWTPGVDEEGNETRHMEVRNIPQSEVKYDEEALSDEEDDERAKRGRSWSKSLDSSWKISKKILTVGMISDDKEKKVDYGGGAPLKKSVSTGGITNSPFKWGSSTAGLGSSPNAGHRRLSSFEQAAAASLAQSPSNPAPAKVKMLNGRVYGARRASDITGLKVKEAEPAFVEWGGAGVGSVGTSVMGSAVTSGSGRSFLGDEDGGSGMEWVKRRREERQRKAREEEERKAREAAEAEIEPPKLSSSQSSQEGIQAVTPAVKAVELPSTPMIHVSEHGDERGLEVPPREATARAEKIHEDVFDEADEDDDGDFSSDEEEEEDFDRTTSSAAGIEVVARHQHH